MQFSGFVLRRLGDAFKTRTLYFDAFLFPERVFNDSVLKSHFTRRNTFLKYTLLFIDQTWCILTEMNHL